MSSVVLVSVLCPDNVGLVAAIADRLYSAGVNLRDTIFAALGHGAEFVAVCELPEGVDRQEIEEALAEIPQVGSGEVRVSPYPFDPGPGLSARITHRFTIAGGDQLGLVARLSEIFQRYGASIVRMEARKLPPEEGGLYVTRFGAFIPEDKQSVCLATVANTAGSLGLTSAVEESRF